MAKKGWLDKQEQQAWRGLVASVMLLDLALDRQLRDQVGLSHTQYEILTRLSLASNHTLHMSDLAALTSSSLSRLSHAVARLEDQGLATRSRCPENGRAVHATLTHTGYEQVRAAAPGHTREVRRLLFDHLSREQVLQLVDITSATLETLSSDGYGTPPW